MALRVRQTLNGGKWRGRVGGGQREGEVNIYIVGLRQSDLDGLRGSWRYKSEVGEVRDGLCHSISMQGSQETMMPIILKSPLDYQESQPGREREDIGNRSGGGEETQIKKAIWWRVESGGEPEGTELGPPRQKGISGKVVLRDWLCLCQQFI